MAWTLTGSIGCSKVWGNAKDATLPSSDREVGTRPPQPLTLAQCRESPGKRRRRPLLTLEWTGMKSSSSETAQGKAQVLRPAQHAP